MNIFLEEYGHQLDAEGKRLVNIVLRNGNKMGLLIDDLLEFSKLGRKELIKTNVSMNDLILGIWDDIFKTDGSRDVKFILNKLPDAFAEKSTMRQVWINLISNAVKYSRNKSKTIIEISGEQKDGQVIYCIKDNGSGFDMRYYDKLFGVFQRLHSQNEFEGTGVGLAIVERIIKKHGGKIWAEGEVDKGATFYISLPYSSVVPKG
jgi:light-regulated signal transduction histidine kinase (bacteriophytochrome)